EREWQSIIDDLKRAVNCKSSCSGIECGFTPCSASGIRRARHHIWCVVSLAAKHIRFQRTYSIQEQNAVEMIDFMQDDSRFKASGGNHAFCPVRIEGAATNRLRALDVGSKIGQAQ